MIHTHILKSGDYFRQTQTQTKPMAGVSRCTLGLRVQLTHSLEDHTWSTQQSTSIHTQHFHNIQQQNNNNTPKYCELFSQLIHKHCQTRNTQDKPIYCQSNTKKYKNITLQSA